MPRVPGEVLLNYASGNRHTDLGSSSGPSRVQETALGPLSHSPGNSGKHCFRQSPRGERIFVEVQVSSRMLEENNISLDALKG